MKAGVSCTARGEGNECNVLSQERDRRKRVQIWTHGLVALYSQYEAGVGPIWMRDGQPRDRINLQPLQSDRDSTTEDL